MKHSSLAWIVIVLSMPVVGGEEPAPAQPAWIWSTGSPAAEGRAWFVCDLELAEPAVGGRVLATCDNSFALWLDGAEWVKGASWEQIEVAPLRTPLAAGRHRLAVAAANDGGPAALVALVELELQSGARHRTVSGAGWLARSDEPSSDAWTQPAAAAEPPPGWAPAHSFGAVDVVAGPWPNPFLPRVATSASAITVPPGFTVELLRSAQPGEGSWVCMTLDPRGRILVSPQSGPLLRMTLPTAPGGKVTVETLDLPVHSAQGLLFAHASLYVTVNAAVDQGGGLHRLRDTDSDGTVDEHRVLASFGPGSEHGAHGLVEGPDGMIYTVHGNFTDLPPVAGSSPHRGYAEDLLLPRLWDPRGHAVGIMAPGARVWRIDPDGARWEMVAAGMRNPYDLAFDEAGELFTYDADMEWDIGAPWYRAPRIIHVIPGGEYGWRSGTGKWPAHYPDGLPAAVETDLSSPTGILFAHRASFPEPFRRTLLAADWAYGRILAVTLAEHGAGFAGSWETFVRGKPLPVTDMEIGDGALYFITGGRGTQSGLYRVTYTGESPTGAAAAPPPPPAQTAARELRHSLERGDFAQEALLAHDSPLDSADRWVSFAARVALERCGAQPAWVLAASVTRPWPGQLACWLLVAREGGAAERARLVDLVSRHPLFTLNRLRLLPSLRVLAIAFARGGLPDEAVVARLRAQLLPVYPSGDAALDRELLAMLVALQAPGLLPRALDRLELDLPPAEQLHVAMCAGLIEAGWDDPRARARFLAWRERARAFQGGLSLEGFVKAMAERTFTHFPPATRPPAETPAAATSPATTAAVAAPAGGGAGRLWSLEDLLPHLERAGAGRSFASGRTAFARALCAACHRVADQGGAGGPDLTGAGNRFSRRDLLEAIVSPSKVISDQYQQVVLTLVDGSTVSGRILDRTAESVVLEQNPLAPTRLSIARAQVRLEEPSAVSTMPPGLLSLLSLDEILDLVAYIENAGDPAAAAFQK